MSFNGVESEFLTHAFRKLEPQYRRVYPDYKGPFDLVSVITFMLTDDGKLTVAKNIDGKLVPDPKIVPVDYKNLKRPDEDLATAVNRVFQYNPA